ncbi:MULTISPECIES: hypothetical protein [Sinorhizobium]|uniref:hypothetical protein n=1 Tax=Sinorhizobium TaxID=28105 RepID=UPI0011450D50|nr:MULTISPECIES: hypothetical protein [Sinorhizobium]
MTQARRLPGIPSIDFVGWQMISAPTLEGEQGQNWGLRDERHHLLIIWKLIICHGRSSVHPEFKSYSEALHPKFEALIAMPPVSAGNLPKQMPARGVYLFSEGKDKRRPSSTPSAMLWHTPPPKLRLRMKLHNPTFRRIT